MLAGKVKGRAERVLVSGYGEGEVLFSDEGLSLWGGVDAKTSEVIDRHHPLSGQRLSGKEIAIPCGRGSCMGSAAFATTSSAPMFHISGVTPLLGSR